MLIKEILRNHHSKMEDENAISYLMMANSKEFEKKYSIYSDIIKIITSKKSSRIKILNIGFAAGVVEKYISDCFGDKVYILSIDNSNTFFDETSKILKTYIDKSLIEFKLADILIDDLTFHNFDIILSRDLNHHLDNIPLYLEKCYKLLNDDGLMVMEDLRYDANDISILEFINSIVNIEVFKNDRWMLYCKLLGLIESFAVSYSTENILTLLDKTEFYYSYLTSPARYHFFLSKDQNVIANYQFLIGNLKST